MPTKAELEARIVLFEEDVKVLEIEADFADKNAELRATEIGQLEARITDQSSIINRYTCMIESLEHERDNLKDTIREQTLNHFDAKQRVISLSKERDLLGGALECDKETIVTLEAQLEGKVNAIADLTKAGEDERVKAWEDNKNLRYVITLLGDQELMKEHEETKGSFGEDASLSAIIAMSRHV